MRKTWLFDDYYSAFATEGFDANHDGQPDHDKLERLMMENLDSLGGYDYFTRIMAGGKTLAVGRYADATTRLKGKRLEMTFLVPLKAAAAVGKDFEYAIYDPNHQFPPFFSHFLIWPPGQIRFFIARPLSWMDFALTPVMISRAGRAHW